MRPYSSFEHLVLSVCSDRGKEWRFVMVDAQTVYVDDSGSDGRSRVASAAFSVSSTERWLEFHDKWQKIAESAGFELKNFHMTEFAACRPTHLCQQCLYGKTTAEDHPWQKWTDGKRENVLRRMAKAVVKYTECGWGIAHTKEDYEEHVRNSPARAVAKEPVGDEHYTFAVQKCGGAFAEWRVTNQRTDHLKFVFDNASPKERYEIAKVFFAGANERSKYYGGVEQWFDPEPNGVSFESRKLTPQLLAPDMIAWTSATLRARQLYRGGRNVELFQLADIFVATKHIQIGYTAKETLQEWERGLLNAAGEPGISELRSDDAGTDEGSTQRDKSRSGRGESGETKEKAEG